MARDVTIYIDPNCPHCRRLREYLQQKGTTFEEHDVTRDVQAQQFLQSKGIDAVPVVRVGDEVMVGFQQERLDKLLRPTEAQAV